MRLLRQHMVNNHRYFAREVEYIAPNTGVRSRAGVLTSTVQPRPECLKAHIKWQPTVEQVTPFGDVPAERVRGLLTIEQCPLEIDRKGTFKIDQTSYSILGVTRSPLDTFYRVLIGVE